MFTDGSVIGTQSDANLEAVSFALAHDPGDERKMNEQIAEAGDRGDDARAAPLKFPFTFERINRVNRPHHHRAAQRAGVVAEPVEGDARGHGGCA